MTTEELYKHYTEKMDEVYNNSPCYDEDAIFGVYRAQRQVILMDRAGVTGEERDLAVKAFVAMADALRFKENTPERIYLWPEGKMPGQKFEGQKVRYDTSFRPYMYEVLVPENVNPKGAVICVAGGGQGRTIINEGFGVALDLREAGYQCFVIHNRVNSTDLQTGARVNPYDCGSDIARAIRYVRANAAKYRIPENWVAAAGFSNGGITIENCILYFSGAQTIRDVFPEYEPDALDTYNGAPDAFLCIYGQRHQSLEFDWEKVSYPPTFEAVGREDSTGALNNLYYVLPDLVAHNVPVEVHTFAATPHGRAAYHRVWEKEDHKNFDLWVPLADAFMQDVYQKIEK